MKVVYRDGNYRTFGDLPTVGSAAPELMLVDTELRNVTLTSWSGTV